MRLTYGNFEYGYRLLSYSGVSASCRLFAKITLELVQKTESYML